MISVIIPCYNCAPFVKRAITSVLNQEFRDFELILVDNRSTDGTIHILNRYKEQYPERVSVFHEYKKGAPAARNKGLSVAAGEWLQFLDADDEIHPEKLFRQAELGKDPDAGVIIGNYTVERNQGRLQENRYALKDPWKGLITSNLGVTSANLWRRKDLLAVDGWNEDLLSSQEYDLLFRLLKNRTKLLSDPSLSTTVHRKGESVSRSANKRKLIEIINNRIRLRHDIKNYLNDTGQLTRELSIMIDTYIYFELSSNSQRIPEYTNSFMRHNMLDVPLNVVLKTNARMKLKRLFSFFFSSRTA